MADLTLLQVLATGQVVPTLSAIRRLDPRTRVVGCALLILSWVATDRVVVALTTLGLTLALLVVARVPLRFARSGLRLVLPWLLIIAALQLAFRVGDAPGCPVLVQWAVVRITLCSAEAAAVALLRLSGLLLLVGLFVWTTPVPELARALEALAAPLDRVGLPAHEVAMVGIIAVRFVPTLAMEAERLGKAQRARGAPWPVSRASFLHRVRNTVPMVVPLFVLALRRAERLAEAMEARAYHGGRARTQYGRLHFGWMDWAVLAGLVTWSAAAVML